MTWVVGVPTEHGYAALYSDIRVTWSNGRVEDCLRKVYEVGSHVAVGFAGHVYLGFLMVADLRQEFSSGNGAVQSPHRVVENWKDRAVWLYNEAEKADPSVKMYRCELLFGSMAPTELVPNHKVPRARVWIMRSPLFRPEYQHVNTFADIGSGGDDEQYSGVLAQLNSELVRNLLEQLENEAPGEFKLARMVLHGVGLPVHVRPLDTVSRHLHMCIVASDMISLHTNGP